MRFFLILAAAGAMLALSWSAAFAQSDVPAASQGPDNVLLAQLQAPAAPAPPPDPRLAQNMAQNVGVDDFQFNELDFDRQGAGGARPSAPPAIPGVQTPAPGDNLVDLFSDQPVSTESLRSLPGAPSPTTTPAAEGQAKIELSPGQPKAAVAQPKAAARPRRRAARRVTPMRSPEDQKGNRWYWAHEAWRKHQEVPLSDCQSYVTNRPLYNVRCVSVVADVNAPRGFVRYPR